MLIEAIEKSITYRWPGGEVRLEPGVPVNLPTDRARRLLAKAAGKVRVSDSLVVGIVIEWDSPLFGLLTAPVLEVKSLSVIVQHPLTEHLATIPRTWIKRIEREQEPAS